MSKFDELKKLDELLKEGVLSQEEFDKEKAKVLGTNKSSTEDVKNDSSKETPKVVENIKEEIKTGKNSKWYGLAAFLILIAVLGQGGSDNDTSQSTVQSSSQETQANRCTRVSQSFLNELAGNDGFDLRNGYVVNSADFQDGWSFVSAEAYNSGGLGIDGKILSWFVDQYPSSNYIEGVGAFGEEYSSWGASINNKKGSPYDDGYSASRDCVK